jgi:hypothetical protein
MPLERPEEPKPPRRNWRELLWPRAAYFVIGVLIIEVIAELVRLHAHR